MGQSPAPRNKRGASRRRQLRRSRASVSNSDTVLRPTRREALSHSESAAYLCDQLASLTWAERVLAHVAGAESNNYLCFRYLGMCYLRTRQFIAELIGTARNISFVYGY